MYIDVEKNSGYICIYLNRYEAEIVGAVEAVYVEIY